MNKLTQKTGCNHGAPVAASLTLPWHKRCRSRQRVILDNGEEAGLFLERGSILRGGDIISSEDGFEVEIIAAPELLSTIECDDSLQLARLCYHLGNRHVDLQISAISINYPHDHVLDEMIRGLGFHPAMNTAPFEPESGAYDDHSTSHNHGHSHG
jgi:urease accessory protein